MLRIDLGILDVRAVRSQISFHPVNSLSNCQDVLLQNKGRAVCPRVGVTEGSFQSGMSGLLFFQLMRLGVGSFRKDCRFKGPLYAAGL